MTRDGEPRRVSREDGQATVEFAIVVPLLLLLIVGIFEFGKAFNYWISLNHLANEGARWAAVEKVPGQPGPTYTCDSFKKYLFDQMNTGDLQSKVVPVPNDFTNITLKVDTSGHGGGAPQIGDPVTVGIKAPNYAIASLGETIDLGNVDLAGSSTMRLEQAWTFTDSTSTAESTSC
jgi:hypothetical protein